MIIAADIGGTKVDIAAFGANFAEEQGLKPFAKKRYFTKNFQNFEDLLDEFLLGVDESVSAIAVGIAGPVFGDRVKLTNLNWTLDRQLLAKRFNCAKVGFLNDMEAHAYGALSLPADGLVAINAGERRPGNQALIAAGTGLGEAFIVHHEGRMLPMACEGGHTSFAPQSQLEADLLKFAQQKHHHVSAERLISGSLGFPLLRDFFAASGRLDGMDPATRNKLSETTEVGPLISELADAGEPHSIAMLKVFIAMYGAEASNLVLKVNGIAGLYIGGGIARKILPWLTEGTFMAAFGNKGRFRQLMEATPVWVVTEPMIALRGLAAFIATRK